MAKIDSYLKVALIFFSFVFINSCKKETGIQLSFHGTIIDGQTMQPISNYPVSLNFINANASMGVNLGSYVDIAKDVTNEHGEFNLKIQDTYSQDSLDKYVIESGFSDNYFGLAKEINAKTAHAMKNNFLETIKVYQKIMVNFYVRHSGIANSGDFILINISGVYNSGNNIFYGTDSLQQNNQEIVPNSPTIISWRGIKNNTNFGPIIDTVSFIKLNDSYIISY